MNASIWFSSDFMFQLSDQEVAILRSQVVAASWDGQRTAPRAFTEQGVAMLSSMLGSDRAIAGKLAQLERRIDAQCASIVKILGAIRQLMAPLPKPKRRLIGFVHPNEE